MALFLDLYATYRPTGEMFPVSSLSDRGAFLVGLEGDEVGGCSDSAPVGCPPTPVTGRFCTNDEITLQARTLERDEARFEEIHIFLRKLGDFRARPEWE